jgi:long-chain acyl-CoA synthetase
MTVSGTAPSSVLAAFEFRASTDPGAVFLSTPEGGKWTYEALSGLAAEVAALIREAGSGPVIGAYGANDPLSMVALLATWKAGRGLACCGRQMPPDGARPLFAMEHCAAVLAADPGPFSGGPWRTIGLPVSPETGSLPPGRCADHAARASATPGRDDLACICFTSGTTGTPKAIPLTHGHIADHVGRMAATPGRPSSFRDRVSPGRPLISFSPFGHNGFHSWLGLALWLGRGLVLVDKFSVDAAASVVAEFGPPTLALTPSMIQMLATAPGDISLAGVRYVTSSTAPLAPDVKEHFTARFGVPILQAYGMTELGNVAREHLADVQAGRQPPGSVGRVSPDREVKIVADDGSPAGPGAEGRLLVRATGKSAAPTGVRLDADGWFDTGDRGALTADGILTITGRSTDRIIVGGFNVSPAEVELELRRSELVTDVVVVGVPDSRLGEIPVAGVVWRGEENEEELRRALRDSLAHYKVPRAFFALTEIPRTPYGKIDRKKAAQTAREVMGGDQPVGPGRR